MTGWRAFRLVPDDVLFFRDGRPASRGDDHYHRSVFPPHPATLYGALRTRRLLDEGIDLRRLGPGRQAVWDALPAALRDELGEWGGFGTLELRGPWLVRGEEVLLPVPADLGVEVSVARTRPTASRRRRVTPELPRVERVARFLAPPRPGGKEEVQGNHLHPLARLDPFQWTGEGWAPWPEPEAPPRPATGWYLTLDGFRRWSEGRAPDPEDLVPAGALWRPEPRVGVAMETERRAGQEGHLFTFGFIRLAPGVSLGFEVRGSGLRSGGRVRLGGEGRTSWLADGPALPATPARSASVLRVLFATPVLSEGGSWPPGFGPGATTGSLNGTPLELRAACLPGYTLVGGWDLAKGRAKPLRRALPAGSVLSLAAPDGSTPVSATQLHGTNQAGYPGDHLSHQGFGLALVGAEPLATS